MYNKSTTVWNDLLKNIKADACVVRTDSWTIVQSGYKKYQREIDLIEGEHLEQVLGKSVLKRVDESIKKYAFAYETFTFGEEYIKAAVNCTRLGEGEALVVISPMEVARGDKPEKKGSSDIQKAKIAEEINEALRLEILQHKETQEKYVTSQKYARNIIDSSLNLVIALGENRTIKEFNKSAERVLGFDKSQILGEPIIRFIRSTSDLDAVFSEIEAHDKFQGEIEFLAASGEKKGLFISVSTLFDDKDQRIGTVWSMKDMTALKFSEQSLALKNADYIDLFENASDLIQGLTATGKLLYVNKSWKKKLGYTSQEIGDICFIDIVHEEDRPFYKKHLVDLLSGKKAKTKLWRVIAKNGKDIIVESNDNLKILDHKTVSIRSIMRDVSEYVNATKLAKEEQAKIKAIFNSGEHMFWTVNENTALTSFNEQYRQCIFQIYGKYPEINKDKTKPKKVFASPEYHAFWAEKYKQVFNEGKGVYFQTKTTNRAGKEQYREVFLNPIFDTENDTKVNEVAGMAIDITEKKSAERLLNEQSKKIKTIFNAAQHMIWSVDCSKTLTSFNDYFAKKHKERFEVDVKAGMMVNDFYKHRNAKAREALLNKYNRALNGEKLQFELSFIDKSGKVHAEEIFLSPIFNEEGHVSEIAAISQTVTFKRTAERKLKDQAAKINAIFDSTAMVIWTVDKNLRLVSFNKVFADQFFKMLKQDVSIGDEFLKTIHRVAKMEHINELKSFYREAFKGNKQQFEGYILGADGKKRWMETFLNPIYLENEEVKEISCLSYEITEKKEIEGQMLESIREKEILLQEVHHRVKNNLQVISSILNLQSAYVKDENSLDILRESQNRIKSMSFIHESLYQTRDFSQIEFSDYILSLTNNLIHSYSIRAGKIRLDTDFMKVYLSLDQAIPCGLIINELVSNALKYAYPDDMNGTIKLVIKNQNNKIEIRVGDSGVGLPAALDVSNSDSLGLQLVYTLVDQLDAEISVDANDGTEYLITFDKR